MKSVIKYIILTSLRDKIYLSIFLALIAIFGIAIFLGNTTLVEQSQTAAIYLSSASRNIIIFGNILFVCLTISKSFENKEVEFIISKPISREKFILSYLIGFLITAFFIILTLVFMLILIAKTNKIGILFWFLSLFCEVIIMISFAFLVSLILKNSFLSILATLGFYLISRMMGIFVLAINLPQNLLEIKNNFLGLILKIISIAFPRLDLFTQSSWIIYGIDDFFNIKIIFLQSLIYIPLMIFMAFHDFRKKQF